MLPKAIFLTLNDHKKEIKNPTTNIPTNKRIDFVVAYMAIWYVFRQTSITCARPVRNNSRFIFRFNFFIRYRL